MLAPNIFLLTWFTYRPLVQAFRLSFFRWDPFNEKFIGLNNYRYWWTDPETPRVLRNTAIFTVFGVGFSIVVGLLFAIFLNNKLRGVGLARSVLFVPFIIPGSAVALVLSYVFDPDTGLLNGFLDTLGIDSPNWYLRPRWALVMVTFTYIWKNVGYVAIVYTAGLSTIAPELYEAAEIDGAGWWGRFRNVVIPGLRPTTMFLIVTSFLGAMQAFDLIDVMTKGGPLGDGTKTLSYQIYDQYFTKTNVGIASAVSTILFLLLLVVSLLQVRGLERKDTR